MSIKNISVWTLLDIADMANPPDVINIAADPLHTIPTNTGWAVTFFYDNGVLDYINHFTSISGEVLNVFSNDRPAWEQNVLQGWCGASSTKQLKEAFADIEREAAENKVNPLAIGYDERENPPLCPPIGGTVADYMTWIREHRDELRKFWVGEK